MFLWCCIFKVFLAFLKLDETIEWSSFFLTLSELNHWKFEILLTHLLTLRLTQALLFLWYKLEPTWWRRLYFIHTDLVIEVPIQAHIETIEFICSVKTITFYIFQNRAWSTRIRLH